MVQTCSICLVMYPVQDDVPEVILGEVVPLATNNKVLDLAFNAVTVTTENATDQASVVVVVKTSLRHSYPLLADSTAATLPLGKNGYLDC